MPFNSPLPSSLASECNKAARILNGFIDLGQGIDKVIPTDILRNAKGLAIFTVLKGGFIFSGRAGSGLVIGKLPDGSFSSPSAINVFGMGFGGQVGAEVTDFVMVLQTQAAVKVFMSHGNITLGGNLSVAAGPVGRNADVSGAASVNSVAAVFSYSKTRGLFAGVSIEGSVIVERFDANAKMYGYKVKAKDLLSGHVPRPAEAEALYQALDHRFYGSGNSMYNNNDMYNFRQPSNSSNRQFTPYSSSSPYSDNSYNNNMYNSYDDPISSSTDNINNNGLSRSQTWSRAAVKSMVTGGSGSVSGNRYRSASTTDRWDQQPSYARHEFNDNDILSIQDRAYSNNALSTTAMESDVTPPTKLISDGKIRARALFNFNAEQDGDLPFSKGDIILITKKSDTQQDWWTGEFNDRKGIFPANFVEII
ncbi:hypothetical protein BJ944DRAFT_280825 [Cunninghamella echinulata]|nr:hypothetical protein BJ944DRAFT_280825 [Cunninghamella echinulata]